MISAAIDLRVISALIQQLPKDAQWTQAERDRWLRAMTSTIDFFVEIKPAEEVK